MRKIKSERYRLYQGNNLDALKLLKDNSVDSVVCDPPYGLGKEPDAYEMMKQWYKYDHYEHKSKSGFMGNSWDAFVPQPAFWKEVFRVLKPGGHVLAFFGSRTLDLGTLAIRLAGFDIRDTMMWLYGSGFPKSLNIGKAITALEKTGTSSPKGLREVRMGKNYKPTGQKDSAKGRMFSSDIAQDSTKTKLTKNGAKFDGWGTSLKPSLEPICLARKPMIGTAAQNTLRHGTGGINIDACRLTIGNAKDAEAFAFNHNGSNRSSKKSGENLGAYEGGWKVQKGEKQIPTGRFPANTLLTHHPDCKQRGVKTVGKGPKGGYDYTGKKEYAVKGFVPKNKPTSASNRGSEEVEDWQCHEDCPVYILDQQSGKSKSTGGQRGNAKGVYSNQGRTGWAAKAEKGESGFGDFGGASRFFYCSKSSRKDRNAGMDSAVDRPVSGGSAKMLSQKSNVNTSTGKKRNPTAVTKNNHPTVKPTELMRYLCRLVTPKNGIVLDPFMGSGSTGRAALLEGFRFIGMELSADYFDIARTRIRSAREHKAPVKSIFD